VALVQPLTDDGVAVVEAENAEVVRRVPLHLRARDGHLAEGAPWVNVLGLDEDLIITRTASVKKQRGWVNVLGLDEDIWQGEKQWGGRSVVN
jgi:hypothetical protein